MAQLSRCRMQYVSKRFASKKKATKKEIAQHSGAIVSLIESQNAQTLESFVKSNGQILNVSDAYAIQKNVSKILESDYGDKYKRLGFKIGATSSGIQAKFKITEPFVSPFYNIYRCAHNKTAEKPQGLTVGVESEFIFRIGSTLKDLNDDADLTLDDIYPLIHSVQPGFELIEPRIINDPILDMPVEYLIADLCWAGGCVIGSESNLRDLGYRTWKEYDEQECRDAAVELYVNSDQRAIGYGREVIGSPFNALMFVYNYLKKTGQTLQEGEFVTTGTVTGCTFLDKKDVAEAVFENIGDVEFKLV